MITQGVNSGINAIKTYFPINFATRTMAYRIANDIVGAEEKGNLG